MAGIDHGAGAARPPERDDDAARNARYGLVLFAVYLVLYGAFVFINAFAPQLMERTVAEGVSVSIVAGFGLIAAAFLLALVYGWLCRKPASSPSRDEERPA